MFAKAMLSAEAVNEMLVVAGDSSTEDTPDVGAIGKYIQ